MLHKRLLSKKKTSDLSLMANEISPEIIVVTKMLLIVEIYCSSIATGYISFKSDRIINGMEERILLYVGDHFHVQSRT